MAASRRNFLIAVLGILALLVPLWPGFQEQGLFMDEGALLVYPELIRDGQVPYRDFETFYGPANISVLAGVYSLTGPTITAERVVGLIYRILIFAAVFALVQRWGARPALASMILTGLFFFPLGIPAFAWIGAVACALWSIWLLTRSGSRSCGFFAGLLGSATLLYRPDLAPAMVLSGLPFFLLMTWRARGSYLAGVGSGMLPLAFLTCLAGPKQVFDNLFVYPVLHCNAGRRLPVFSADFYLIGLLALAIGAVVVNFAAGFSLWRRDRKDISARLLLGLAGLSLGLLHQATQRFDIGHFVTAAVIPIPLLPVSLALLFSRGATEQKIQTKALTACALVLLAMSLIAPEFIFSVRREVLDSVTGKTPSTIDVENASRSFPVRSPRDAITLHGMLEVLKSEATAGQRLFVGPADMRRTNYNETFIYYLLPQLTPASYFLEMNPFSANRPDSRLAADVATADWLVLTHRWDNWNEPNESMKLGPDAPNEVVRNQFELKGRFDSYDLYRRRSPVASKN